MNTSTIESIPFCVFQFYITPFLNPEDLLNLTLVNQYCHATQLPTLIRYRVFIGNSTLSQVLLALTKVIFTDHAERTFYASMYEYALFSKDTKLQMLIEEGIPKITDPYERSKAYYQLQEQYNNFMKDGIRYTILGHEKRFSMQENADILASLITAYEIYLKSPNQQFLVHTIGSLQKRLPLNMLLEMTNQSGFMPKKNGVEMTSLKEAVAKVYYTHESEDNSYYDSTYHPTHILSRLVNGFFEEKYEFQKPVNLGTEYALVRGGKNDAGHKPFAVTALGNYSRREESAFYLRAMNGFVNTSALKKDYEAFKKLNAMRTKELEQAKHRILDLEQETPSCTIS